MLRAAHRTQRANTPATGLLMHKVLSPVEGSVGKVHAVTGELTAPVAAGTGLSTFMTHEEAADEGAATPRAVAEPELVEAGAEAEPAPETEAEPEG